jgi:PAS domain S-box-containing protein
VAFVDVLRYNRGMTTRSRAQHRSRPPAVSETVFRRCFELGLIGLAVTSPLKGILEANDELCRILGYRRSELLQRTWTELTHPDDLAADLVQYERVLGGEIDGYYLDKRWIRKDGAIVDSITSAQCERRADGAVDYFVGLVQDITERKRAETETLALKNALRDLTGRLIEAQEAQSTHLARELHDVLSERLDRIGHELTRLAAAPDTQSEALSAVGAQVRAVTIDLNRMARELDPLQISDDTDHLTPRQRAVIHLAAIGQSTKQIADTLTISPRTVEFHRYHAMKGLGLHTIAELVQYAIKHQIIRIT